MKRQTIETKALRPQKEAQAVYTLGAFLSELLPQFFFMELLPQFLGFWLGDGGVGEMCSARITALDLTCAGVARAVKIEVCPRGLCEAITYQKSTTSRPVSAARRTSIDQSPASNPKRRGPQLS